MVRRAKHWKHQRCGGGGTRRSERAGHEVALGVAKPAACPYIYGWLVRVTSVLQGDYESLYYLLW